MDSLCIKDINYPQLTSLALDANGEIVKSSRKTELR